MISMGWPVHEIAIALRTVLVETSNLELIKTKTVRLIQTDSRQVGSDDLFVCLQGDRFDAHQFVPEVIEQGCLGVVTDRLLPLNVAQWVVRDTRKALGLLALNWRSRFNMPVVGVVGSNGKTTCKEMLASVAGVGWSEHEICSTQGNLNNEIGVPLTLFRLRSHHRFAVIEMGMNHPGEISVLAEMVKPNSVLLTNAQREHQEFMKSVALVAQENGTAFTWLNAEGVAVFPADTPFDKLWCDQAKGRKIIRFGTSGQVALVARSEGAALRFGQKFFPCSPKFMGAHHYSNASGVAAVCRAMGFSEQQIVQGLERFTPVQGRFKLVCDTDHLKLIDDTYNANPDSVNAASEYLSTLPGSTVLVLGDMGEVGDQAENFHREVGDKAKKLGINKVFLLGEHTRFTVEGFGVGAQHYENIESLLLDLNETLRQQKYTVLVKGSRFMKMERVVQALTASTSNTPNQGEHYVS